MKYFPLLLILLAVVAWLLDYFNPGSGWIVATYACGAVAILWLGINKYRTGKFITDSAGGR